MSYKAKRKIKKVFLILFSLIVLMILIGIAYLSNKIIEMIIIMCLFYIYRKISIKQYHAKSIYQCAIITTVVFFTALLMVLPLKTSVLFPAIITFIISMFSYYARDYLDKVKELNNKAVVCKKPLENYTKQELLDIFPNIKSSTINLVYDYLHRERSKTALDFAYDNNVSEQLIYNYLRKVKAAYKDLN